MGFCWGIKYLLLGPSARLPPQSDCEVGLPQSLPWRSLHPLPTKPAPFTYKERFRKNNHVKKNRNSTLFLEKKTQYFKDVSSSYVNF